MPNAEMIYPFVPHRPLAQGEQSNNPLLSYYCYDPPAPSRKNAAEFHQWLLDHIEVNPSDDLIQELYDMASEGQLMVFDGSKDPDIHQVQLRDGEIFVTDSFLSLSANHEFPLPPQMVSPPENRAPDLPQRPVEPEPPGEEPKSTLSRLGDLLHIETDYTRYKNRQKAYDAYLIDLSRWEGEYAQRMQEWESTAEERTEQLRQQTAAFNQYYQEVSNFFMDPLARFSIAWGGLGNVMYQLDDDEISAQRLEEEYFWADFHRETPQGQMQSAIDSVMETRKETRSIRAHIDQMFGPIFRNNNDRIMDGILKSHTLKPYAAPQSSEIAITNEQAGLICFAALANATVLGTDIDDERLISMGAQERYQKILDGFFLKNEEGSDYLFPFVPAARAEGVAAMQNYAQGDPTPLAQILGSFIRRQNEIASAGDFYRGENSTYAHRSFSLTAALLNVLDQHSALLDQHPALLEHCPLQPDELQQARANAAIYQMAEKGLHAKADLLGHALYQKSLPEEQLRSAISDLLFMNTMNAQAASGQDIRRFMSNPEAVKVAKNTLMKSETLSNLMKLDRTELGKAVASPQLLFAKVAPPSPTLHGQAPQKHMESSPISHQPKGSPPHI